MRPLVRRVKAFEHVAIMTLNFANSSPDRLSQLSLSVARLQKFATPGGKESGSLVRALARNKVLGLIIGTPVPTRLSLASLVVKRSAAELEGVAIHILASVYLTSWRIVSTKVTVLPFSPHHVCKSAQDSARRGLAGTSPVPGGPKRINIELS